MATDENKISKIKLPDGNTYALEDENVGISSTYDSSTKTVTLTVGSLGDADTTGY